MPRTTPEAWPARRALAVVTDLDGCLLDAQTFDFEPARGTLRLLRRLGVPLVLCTSKTRAEVRALYAALGSRHLAVIEDGAAVLVPPGVAPRVRLPGARPTGDGRLLALAKPYPVVRRAFTVIRRRTRCAAVGLGDLSLAAVGARTGLPPGAARRAARREFDEPFVFVARESHWAGVARRTARQLGLVVTKGGRFYHLHGLTDKGRAVRVARAILDVRSGPLTIVALGDSPLDAAFLAEVEVPIIVPRPDGRADPVLRRRVPHARVAPAPGPAGWARAVEAVLREVGRQRPRRPPAPVARPR